MTTSIMFINVILTIDSVSSFLSLMDVQTVHKTQGLEVMIFESFRPREARNML